MKIFFTSVLYFALNSNMFSQCVMGGDLTTRRLSGYYFEFILTIISDTNCECTDVFVISFGDGSSQILTRTSTISLPDSNSKDIYKAIHTYPGPGIFSVVVTGCNWVPDINNIVNSGSEQFKAFNNLSINASFTNNNTPVLIYPGYDIATVNHVFVYNPVAYDTDGDSLSYGLEHCNVTNYSFPPADIFTINEITGDLIWDKPVTEGLYAIAISVNEFRNGLQLGQTLRQMTVKVKPASGIYNSVHSKSSISVYPNITNGMVYFERQAEITGKMKIQLLNHDGKILSETVTYEKSGSINLASYSGGFYFIQIIFRDFIQYTIKIIKY